MHISTTTTMTIPAVYRPTQTVLVERDPPREAGDEDRLVLDHRIKLSQGHVTLVIDSNEHGPQITITTSLQATAADRHDEDGDPLVTTDITSEVKANPDGWGDLVFFARQILAMAGER